MKTLKSFSGLRKMIDQQTVYVRWSKSFALDSKRGYSLRCGSYAEAGLSACELKSEWPDWKIALGLQEYSHCPGDCRILTGTVVGRGGDGEPLLADAQQVAIVDREWIGSLDWLQMWRDKYLAETLARHERMQAAGHGLSEWETRRLERLQSGDRIAWEKIYYG